MHSAWRSQSHGGPVWPELHEASEFYGFMGQGPGCVKSGTSLVSLLVWGKPIRLVCWFGGTCMHTHFLVVVVGSGGGG